MTDAQTPNERRRFLIDLAERSLDQFERGGLTLESLVSDIDATITALRDVAPTDWVEEVISAWSGLETVHAVMLDEGRSQMTPEDTSDVAEVVRDLRSALQVEIGRFP
jgi:hypothetical protein